MPRTTGTATPIYPLSDGPLHARTFVDEVVAPLSAAAHRVHIVLDTCFAGALVRARAKVERTTPRDVQQAFGAEGIRRFPNVGALVGASAGTQAFEWTDIRSGVFSAMVRGGLRGAADVDGDGQVRYRELSAFLAAASYDVPMKAAQPRFSVYPPAVDRNAALMKRSWLGDIVTLRSDLSPFGAVQILDGSGAFLVAATFEPGFAPTLWLPRGRPLFLRARGADHALVVGEDGLQVGEAAPAEIVSRSLVGSALRKGLFKARFGPAFYSGFAASRSAAPPPTPSRRVPLAPSRSQGATWGTTQFAGVGFMLAGTLVAGVAATSSVFTAISLVRYATTDLERSALIHISNSALTGTVALVAFAASALMIVIGVRIFTFVDE